MIDKLKLKKTIIRSGRQFAENENCRSIGDRGPLLLQHYFLHEKSGHFNRECIPERYGSNDNTILDSRNLSQLP